LFWTQTTPWPPLALSVKGRQPVGAEEVVEDQKRLLRSDGRVDGCSLRPERSEAL
jgi:hypothetical protein